MSQASTDKLIELVRRSELVPTNKLEAFFGRLATAEAGVPSQPTELAQRLIAEGLLTRWQADKLLAGKHRGFRLGKYKLLGQIGKGGMSHVYLAEHVLMQRRVAIKVLPKQRVKDKSYLQRFQLEARAAARLDDPNIVRVYDIDNDADTHYIVMEYVEGRDLHQTVSQDGPLPFNTAAQFVAQVATGLQHAHEMGLVHRDIKPANCLVDQNKIVKLLDMGLAKLQDDEASLTLAHDENVLGTADYLAPEQALNSHTADARADIYSLGCTLYFLIAARPPFPEGTISERLLKHQVEEPDSLLKTRPDCPLSLVDICQRMMCKKPDGRPQTAGEVARLLNEWLAEQGEAGAPMNLSTAKLAGEPRGSGVGSGGFGSGGVGSGILSRYNAQAAGAHPPGPAGTTPQPAGNRPGTPPASDTAKLYAEHSVETDEDMSLAPLDEEQELRREKLAKKAAASSDVLSEESGSKLPGARTGKSSAPGSGRPGAPGSGKPSVSGSGKPPSGVSLGAAASPGANQQLAADAASLSSPGKATKPKSIFEEEYASRDAMEALDPIARRAARANDYDPLHPPGFVNPYTKTPWWVFAAAGGAVLVVLLLLVRLFA